MSARFAGVLMFLGWLGLGPSTVRAQTNAAAAPPAVVAQREYELGLSFQANGQLAGALEAFQRATLLRPTWAEPQAQVGITLLQMGKQSPTPQQQLDAYRVAAEKLAQATSLQTTNTLFLMHWAEALTLIGDLPVEGKIKLACYQGALEKYQRVTELAPQQHEAYLRWGVLLTNKLAAFASEEKARADVHQSAAELLGKAVAHAKFSAELGPAAVMWGTALARQGRYTSELDRKKKLLRTALEKFESAARAVPNTASTYALWGAAALELGKLTRFRNDYRDAVSHLNTSLALNPNDPATLFTLACAYALMDNARMAINTLRECLAQDPDNTYRSAARTEADLAGLRGNPDFEDLLSQQNRPAVQPFNPPLSNSPR